MNNSIIEILPKDLKVVKSLKELSYDSFNSEYMTESEITAIDFDKVKDSYIINNLESVNPNPKSNDHDTNLSNIIDVTNSTSDIYAKLASPLRKLENLFYEVGELDEL